MKHKEICTYFLEGRCNRGNKCNFSHDIPQGVNLVPQTCQYFLTNSCKNKKDECRFFHGFGGCLLHMKSIKVKQEYIQNLVKMDDTKFISSDEKGFIVFFIQNEKPEEKPFILDKEGFKIGKMIFSSNKAIFALRREGK